MTHRVGLFHRTCWYFLCFVRHYLRFLEEPLSLHERHKACVLRLPAVSSVFFCFQALVTAASQRFEKFDPSVRSAVSRCDVIDGAERGQVSVCAHVCVLVCLCVCVLAWVFGRGADGAAEGEHDERGFGGRQFC